MAHLGYMHVAGDPTESLAKYGVEDIHCSNRLIIEGSQINEARLTLGKSTLAIPSLSRVLQNGFQEPLQEL